MDINETFIKEIINQEEEKLLLHLQQLKQFLTERQYKQLLKTVFKDAIKRYKKTH